MQEAHNKWRQTQEAGHAVVLQVIFLPLSFNHKLRLSQPLQNNYINYWRLPKKQAGSRLSILITIPPPEPHGLKKKKISLNKSM